MTMEPPEMDIATAKVSPLAPSTAPQAAAPSSAGAIPLAQSQQDSLIMLVDDEPTTLEVLQMFLEEAGYRNFLTTSDSREALGLLTSRRPDVLLLDLMMPHVGGFDILRKMRTDPTMRHVPVIMLTSSTDAQTKLTALELGATDFLGKPVDPSELALRLRNTLSAKAYQDRLALYDRLTGLPNRHLFTEQLERILWSTRSHAGRCAVVHVDLNRFRQLNDYLGHTAGDALLKTVAQRLDTASTTDSLDDTVSLPEMPLLARIGGDEFALVLKSVKSEVEVMDTAKALCNAMAPSIHIGGREVQVHASIGVALYPDDGDNADALLRHATTATATSHAKQRGLTAYQFYSRELNEESRTRVELEADLFKALAKRQLALHYQPKLCLRTGKVTGFEALLRWDHPERGQIPPGAFIPLAEATGLITSIGQWVLHQACQQLRAWHDAGHSGLQVAVNVSAVQFREDDLLETVGTALLHSGIPSHCLTVELTETVLMENVDDSARILEALRNMGVRISVDDFGTGYSSLSYLRRFSIDELKVDRSFVRDVPANADASAIIAAVVGMARGLGLKVVAEGVEEREQLKYLQSLGTDEFRVSW
jgi:diguanylate cyclase (GGDEF)-like protein